MTFERWMTKHRMHLIGYTPDEIARLALCCGFTMAEIVPEVSSWLARSQRMLRLMEKPDLWEKWTRVALAQMGHD